MPAISRPILASPLAHMLADIADATRMNERHVAVGLAMAPYLGQPNLLAGRDCPCNPDRYCRHLLYNDSEAGYAVVAIVWIPGQMSPVHGHRTWCALGVHRGWLAETWFKREAGLVTPSGCKPRGLGAISHSAADLGSIHRVANLGTEEAVSIHVYGVEFERFGDGVNEVYAA